MSPTSAKTKIADDGAFTLLELLLVVTLMAMLTAITLPRLMQVHSRTQLERSAETMAAYIRNARIEAVKRGLAVRMEFSNDASAYRLLLQETTAKYEKTFTEADESFYKEWRLLPERTRITRVISTSGTTGPAPIVLDPSGATDASEIILEDRSAKTQSVFLGPLPTDVTSGPSENVSNKESSL